MTTHRMTRALGALAVMVSLAVGCSDNSEGGGEGDTSGAPECVTAADCGAGELCEGGACGACASDAACAADDRYGAGATCADGACEVVTCETGAQGCACFSNSTCGAGLRCEDDGCAPCPAGEQGCACDAGGCDEGLTCDSAVAGGTCVPDSCVAGAEGCPCDEDACDEGLVCGDADMCVACTPEFEGCPCDEEGACEGDLVCAAPDDDPDGDEVCREAKACADLGCVDNQRCEDASAGVDAVCLEECLPRFTWNSETGMCDAAPDVSCAPGAEGSILAECDAANRVCEEAGGGASCGACKPSFIEEGQACRPVVECATLEATCAAENRDCVPHTTTADATCGACRAGFEEDGGACVPTATADCQPGSEISILAECDAVHRVCVEEGGGAMCGACAQGFVEDPAGPGCVAPVACAELDCASLQRRCDEAEVSACGDCLAGYVTDDLNDTTTACRLPRTCAELECGDGEFCREGDTGAMRDAACEPWPCVDDDGDPASGQALREDTFTCIDCGSCGEDGETGRVWPFTVANSDRCICETEPGFFFSESGNLGAQPCDEDQDGWLRTTARAALESQDPAVRENARCAVREIDRFVLENVHRQRLDVFVCDDGLVPALPCNTGGSDDACGDGGVCTDAGRCGCEQGATLALYESPRNDDQRALSGSLESDVPTYDDAAGNGRRMRAEELNPLTRACVSTTADHNNNQVADVNEWHGMRVAGAEADRIIFNQMSYFMELHASYFVSTGPVTPGRYHIVERSRCAGEGFPFGYPGAGSWWRSCARSRDTGWDPDAEGAGRFGFDFAQYGCGASTEGCPLPPPPTQEAPGDDKPLYDICDGDLPLPPADGVWRGMNHHAQFKCVVVGGGDDGLTIPASDFGEGRPFRFNRCHIQCPEGDAACEGDCTSDATCATSYARGEEPVNPATSVVSCDGGEPSDAEVGFALVSYTPSEASPGGYLRGCIDEGRHWPQLCPGQVENPNGVIAEDNPANYGLLVCGCGLNYNGVGCKLGCANADDDIDNDNNIDPGALGAAVHYGGDQDGPFCTDGYCPVLGERNNVGWWMCGESTSNLYTSADPEEGAASVGVSDGGVWTATGAIPANGVQSSLLCEDPDNCNSGWSSR